MLVRVSFCLVLAWASLAIAGCGPSLVNMSAGQIGCRPGDVTITDVQNSFGARSWVARCRGAEFSCSQVTTGGGPTTTSSQVNCAPIQGGRRYDDEWDSGPVVRSNPSTASSGANSRSGSHGAGSVEVKRGYDEGRGAHFVTGKFGIAQGLHVIVSGAPKVSMGTISVTLSGYSADTRLRLCESLEVLINGEPMSTDRNVRESLAGKVKIESRFDFPVFQPLAGNFPVFGVRACGTSWAFTPHQLEQLRALFVVYSDLAKAIQNDPEATPATAPGQTAL